VLLKDKVVVITGGGSGVGRETAKLFAREGARIVIGDIREEWGTITRRMVQDLGGDATFVPTDVTREHEVQRLVQTALDAYGALDILFNNVGVATPRPHRPTWEYSDADWDRLMNTNLRSVFYGCKHAIPVMKEKGGGVILNTGSAAGLVAWGGVPYGVSKAGVIHLTKSLAVELASVNIRVNCLCPGPIDTNFGKDGSPPSPEAFVRGRDALNRAIPLGRVSDAGEAAWTALYLASDMSSYVTGAALVLDGGYSIR